MPTNFTVVPVDDVEEGGSGTAAGRDDKPVSLGKIFGEKQDDEASQGPPSGKNTQLFYSWSLSQHALGGRWVQM